MRRVMAPHLPAHGGRAAMPAPAPEGGGGLHAAQITAGAPARSQRHVHSVMRAACPLQPCAERRSGHAPSPLHRTGFDQCSAPAPQTLMHALPAPHSTNTANSASVTAVWRQRTGECPQARTCPSQPPRARLHGTAPRLPPTRRRSAPHVSAAADPSHPSMHVAPSRPRS